ncbi:MAG: hypothetical protein GY778_14515, partial [bacterium]|nr:hypothetical protein [bacterium]
SRSDLREHFEVNAGHIAVAALHTLAARGAVKPDMVSQAIRELGINADKPNPATI